MPMVMMLLLMKKRLIRLTVKAIHMTLEIIPFPMNLKVVKSSLVVIAYYVSPIVAARVAEADRSTLEAVYIEQRNETR